MERLYIGIPRAAEEGKGHVYAMRLLCLNSDETSRVSDRVTHKRSRGHSCEDNGLGTDGREDVDVQLTRSPVTKEFLMKRESPGEIAFENVCLSQRGHRLLSDLTATVPAGTTLAVMGRSGTGKTTLLRTIAGLIDPASGAVSRPAGRVPFVFQEPRLLPWRTTLENVELVLPAVERGKAREWLARVGLSDAVDAWPLTLSGGMRQRVSIARALACESPIVLVDEPFSHLDIATADELRRELHRHLVETGRTCVWVTHNPAEAAAVAERTLMMSGPPEGLWEIVEHGRYLSSERLVVDLSLALESPDTR